MKKRRPRARNTGQVRADQFQSPPRQPAVQPGRKKSRRKKKYAETRKRAGQERSLEIAKTILIWSFQIMVAILFAYITIIFFGQTRTNIGQSMEMTLQGGDTVLINVFAYQAGRPKRGDIISFKPNGSETAHSNIKRVIGLPGETVQIREGIIYIDGQVLMEDKNYPAITNPGMASEEIHLGTREYFVLGDNRNNSEDSRFADIGPVSADHIEGKVWYILSPAENRGLIRD